MCHCAVCSCALPSPRGPLYLNAETTKKEQNTYKKILALYTQTQYYKNRPVLYIYLSFALPTLCIAREKKKRGVEERMPSLLSNNSISGVWPPNALQGRKLPAPLSKGHCHVTTAILFTV